jgi:pimeloyl-ACP methyl ester carboxylesterase
MKEFKFKDQSLFYRVSGEGSPVLFLHGFLEDHTMWDAVTNQLAKENVQCILVDLPCHGKSRYTQPVCSMTEIATLLNEFLLDIQCNVQFVIGHSMGGYVALELLKLRTFKLALLHSNFWADSAKKKIDRDRVVAIVSQNKMKLLNEAIPNLFAEENRVTNQNVINALIKNASAIPTNEIIASTKGMRNRLDNSGLLDQHPITIIQGENDTVVKLSKLRDELDKVNSDTKINIIPHCGHMSIWEQPQKLINLLKTFVFK